MSAYHMGKTCGFTCGYCGHCCSNLLRSAEAGDIFLECQRCGGFQPPPDGYRDDPFDTPEVGEKVERRRVASSG